MGKLLNYKPKRLLSSYFKSLPVKQEIVFKGEKGEKGERGEKGEQGIQGIQGLRGIQGELGLQGIQGVQGIQGEQGLQGSPDTGEQIVEKINNQDTKIDASKIKNLPKAEKINAKLKRYLHGGGDIILCEDLTSQCNGATKTFTIPAFRKSIALFGTQFPVIYRPTIDWTATGTTLTLTAEVSAPESGQTLTFLYVL